MRATERERKKNRTVMTRCRKTNVYASTSTYRYTDLVVLKKSRLTHIDHVARDCSILRKQREDRTVKDYQQQQKKTKELEEEA